MNRSLLIPGLLMLVLWLPQLSAQAPPNDDCSGAIVITDPSNFCITEIDAGFANPSPEALPSCFWNNNKDLWYTFTAIAPDAAITSELLNVPLGLIGGQQMALYSGDCNNLTEVDCSSNLLPLSNTILLYAHNLVVGQTYYLRVDASSSFLYQICIRNEDEATLNEVSGDCPTATPVCNKLPIVVHQVFGAGYDVAELNDAPCFNNPSGETSSGWYVFTAANNGKLEFTITPGNPNDDIDFVVYRLPNGPGNCTGKVWERCMNAGDLDPTSPCMGPTGLNSSATDIAQPAGCGPGLDNYLRYLNLVQGRTYVLAINNFTRNGTGFTLEWGGDALFTNTSCCALETTVLIQPGCPGDPDASATLEVINAANPLSIVWSNGQTDTLTATLTNSGTYSVEIEDANGCRDSLNFTINTPIQWSGVFPPDTTVIAGQAITLGLTSIPNDSLLVYWITPNGDTLQGPVQTLQPEESSVYLLFAHYQGCVFTDSLILEVQKPKFAVPNAFTPNGDGSNDAFRPVLEVHSLVQLEIWSRWGEKVFDTLVEGKNAWDGNINGISAPSDVYVYRVRVRLANGEEKLDTGEVTLLR